MKITFNGKEIDCIEIDGVDALDYPDFCDAYFSAVYYEDGTQLTEEEVALFTEQNGDLLHELSHEYFR